MQPQFDTREMQRVGTVQAVRQSAIVTPATPRKARARKAGLATRDFDRVYREPSGRQRSRHFLVLARRRDDGPACWGISVKAKLGGAVLRNRIKRRLREILRAAPLPPAWDIVVQPQSPAVASTEFAVLRRELEDLLRDVLSDRK